MRCFPSRSGLFVVCNRLLHLGFYLLLKKNRYSLRDHGNGAPICVLTSSVSSDNFGKRACADFLCPNPVCFFTSIPLLKSFSFCQIVFSVIPFVCSLREPALVVTKLLPGELYQTNHLNFVYLTSSVMGEGCNVV